MRVLLLLDGKSIVSNLDQTGEFVIEQGIGPYVEEQLALRSNMANKTGEAEAIALQWQQYLNSGRRVPHLDYRSQVEASELDSKMMASYLDGEPDPLLLEPSRPVEQGISVDVGAISRAENARARILAELIEATFQVQERKKLNGGGAAELTSVPSKGARNPVFCALNDGEGIFGEPQMYRYDRYRNRLASIDAMPTLGETSIILSIRFDVVQWRYRHSWAYREVWFDLGHVIAHLQTLGDALNVRVTHDTLVPQMPAVSPHLLISEVAAKVVLSFGVV